MAFFEKIRQGDGNGGGSPWAISGTVTLSNLSTVTANQGTPGASAWPVSVVGSISGPLGVSGTVGVNALPLPVGVSGTLTVQTQVFDGTNWQNLPALVAVSGTPAINTLATVPLLRNGTNYLPWSDVVAALAGTGPGIAAAGNMVFSSSTWQRLASPNAFGDGAAGLASSNNSGLAVGIWAANGAGNFDRIRVHSLSPSSGTVATPSGTLSVASAFSYRNIASSGTIGIKTGAGILHAVVINTRGTGSTLQLFDSQVGAGTLIATIDTTQQVGAIPYDVRFNTGLVCLVPSASIAADITISYL